MIPSSTSKTLLVSFVTVSFLSALIGCSAESTGENVSPSVRSVSGDCEGFSETIPQLVASAHAIVVGTVQSESDAAKSSDGHGGATVYRDLVVKVETTLAGTDLGATVTVYGMAWEEDSNGNRTPVTLNDNPFLKVGDRAVMPLTAPEEGSGRIGINCATGSFPLKDGEVVDGNKDSLLNTLVDPMSEADLVAQIKAAAK